MPLAFLKRLNDQQWEILGRFREDIEKLANNVQQTTTIIDVGKTGDVPYVIADIKNAFEQNAHRVDMMAESLTWQAYQLGMAQALFEESNMVVWNLDAGANHCDTCLEYAAIRYFTPDTLPGIPGNAPTICDGGCRCYLT